MTHYDLAVIGTGSGNTVVTKQFKDWRVAILEDNVGDERLASVRPPVFWGRGTVDQVIAPDKIEYTEGWLPDHSTLTARIYEGLPHSISRPELDDANAFMREVWSAS